MVRDGYAHAKAYPRTRAIGPRSKPCRPVPSETAVVGGRHADGEKRRD